ncbi:MAG TPA: 50S ribosomal protein L6 [Rhabdochlamydiaceae bacterium]|nr:50S ribosomal protein L6 [Rhabdochlamydiaceae bacterium]
MARYGKTPIPLPKGVELKVQNGQLMAKGPKGSLTLDLPAGIGVNLEDGKVFVTADEAAQLQKPTHGLYRSMVSNIVKGVSVGYEKRLSLVGVGYRAAISGSNLDLQLGFSHPLKVAIPKEIKIVVDKSVLIIISGIDKQIVGQFAAQVRALRPPEPYKGKGIRYEDEYVRKKAGKAAKGKGAPGA